MPFPVIPQSINSAITESLRRNGLREDLTQKQNGYFGNIQNPNGGVSGELSIGVNFGGKEQLIPSLVPTLNADEVNHLLSGASPTRSILQKAVEYAKERQSQGLSPFASNDEVPFGIKLPEDRTHSLGWQADQWQMGRDAMNAGLPSQLGTGDDSIARLRLIDAAKRAGSPHFIGNPGEPLGDRGVTMDIEELVKALKAQEVQAIKSGNRAAVNKISKERAYWEKEAANGMSAQEWLNQTGEADPVRQ